MKMETITYRADLTGEGCEPMTNSEPIAALRLDFGYGSKMDGAHGDSYLRAGAARKVWALLRHPYPQSPLAEADAIPLAR